MSAQIEPQNNLISNRVFNAGVILSLALIGFGSCGKSDNSNGNIFQSDNNLITCGGVAPELSPSSPLVKISINQNCYSVVMIAPSANSRIDIIPKKSADVCFWNGKRCVARMNIGYRKAPTVLTRKDIPKKNYPEYSSILIKGDPGDTEVRLSR